MKKIIFTLLPLLLLSVFFFCWESKKSILRKGLNALLIEDYPTVDKTLIKLNKKKDVIPITFYEGYVQLACKNYQASSYKMQQALAQLPFLASSEIVAEIFLAEAAASALDGKEEEVAPLVKMAEKTCKHHPLLPFFSTLRDFFEGNYSTAAKNLEDYQFPIADKDPALWLSPILAKLFTRSWLEIHRAHALCMEKNFEEARNILEKELFVLPSQNDELESLGHLFLGHTYLKEATFFPPLQKAAYLKMAILTFKSANNNAIKYLCEKKVITQSLKEEIINSLPLLCQNEKPTLEEAIFSAITLLEEWEDNDAIETLAAGFANFLINNYEKGGRNSPQLLCKAIKNTFDGTSFHAFLMENLLNLFSSQLKEKENIDLFEMGQLIALLCENPENYQGKLAGLAISEIYRAITLDDASLERTQMFLTFHKQNSDNINQRFDLAKKLLHHATLLWQREGQESKGTRLMDLVLSFSPSQEVPNIRKEIQTFLTDLYSHAEQANTVRRLTLLHDAFEHFQIERQNLVSPVKIANHLADGYYHLSVNQHFSAQLNAEFVLKLDPDNQQAIRLHGLASFHQGEYYKALCSLTKVDCSDPETAKALILSEIFVNSDYNGQLANNAVQK